MMCVSLLTLLGMSWVLLPCKGQSVTVTPDKNEYDVLKGEDVELKWVISGIELQTLDTRVWRFVKTNENLAGIVKNNDVIIFNTTILGDGFDVRKPSSLILKKVDEGYDGVYRFSIAKGIALDIDSDVTVLVLKIPIITFNCSNVSYVNQSDYFACECSGTDGNPPADVTWYKDNTKVGDTGKENAILRFTNVDKDDSGMYRCEAKSHEKAKNETSIELIVTKTPKISVNCSSPTTAKQGDYFAWECKGTDGNPPANVTWYKDKKKIVTGKEKAILRFTNVDKDDSGTYRCEAISHEKGKNQTFVELIVNYPPENVKLVLTNGAQSVTITCTADARPEPSFKIFFNCDMLIKSDKTCRLHEVNSSHVGLYKCVARNILGQRSSVAKYFSLVGTTPPLTTTSPSRTSQTTTNDNARDKICSDNTTSGTEWYIIVVTLVSGIIMGVLLSYIVQCSHRRGFRKRKPKRNPDEPPTEADSTYQELDLSKMNQEDNYQSLRGNAARINDVTNDDESTYTELSKTRDVEDNYQSLT